jgi:hypothetical protein
MSRSDGGKTYAPRGLLPGSIVLRTPSERDGEATGTAVPLLDRAV